MLIGIFTYCVLFELVYLMIQVGYFNVYSERSLSAIKRPIAAGHDWPLYGDGYDRMKFGNVPTDFKRRVGNAF